MDAPVLQSEPSLSPLMLRAVHILLTLLQLRLPAAWKSMQLSVVMLWNSAVQSGEGHARPLRQLSDYSLLFLLCLGLSLQLGPGGCSTAYSPARVTGAASAATACLQGHWHGIDV